MYIKLTNGVPETYTIGKLRKDNPNVSFPKQIPESILAQYDVYSYVDVPPSSVEDFYILVEEFVQDNATWLRTWNAKLISEEDAANLVRTKRNELLHATDFYALTDVNMPIAVVNYRQALRDITIHENFPYLNETDWPVKP